MRHSDLADYLDHDPFLEPSEPQPKASAKSGVSPEPKLSIPVAPDKPTRSAETERDKHTSDVLRMVMEVFPGARWTTRDEYQRLAHHRDRRGRKKRA